MRLRARKDRSAHAERAPGAMAAARPRPRPGRRWIGVVAACVLMLGSMGACGGGDGPAGERLSDGAEHPVETSSDVIGGAGADATGGGTSRGVSSSVEDRDATSDGTADPSASGSAPEASGTSGRSPGSDPAASAGASSHAPDPSGPEPSDSGGTEGPNSARDRSAEPIDPEPTPSTPSATVSNPFVAEDTDASTAMDVAVAIVLRGNGPEGVPLVFAVTEEPAHGVLEGEPPELLYIPEAGFSGEDAFSFVVGDGDVWSPEAVVRVAVRPPNRPPVAFDLEVDAAMGRATAFRLLAEDPDGDDLTFAVVDAPTHGEVTLEGDVATYWPPDGFLGEDTFSFVADDGALVSDPATVRVHVLRLANRPPEVESFSVDTDQGQPVTFALRGLDPDGDPLMWQIVEEPGRGAWSRAGAEVTYAPEAGFHGEDRLVYRASDGLLTSEPGEVTLRVRRVNRPPVAQDLHLTGDRGAVLTGRLRASDPDGDSISFELLGEPAHGTASLTGDVFTYTPDPAFVGMDRVSFRAFDGALFSPAATITLILRRVNRPPVAHDIAVEAMAGEATVIPLAGEDPDGDSLTWLVETQPAVGVVTLNGAWATLDLTGAPEFTGELAFTVRAFDGELTSEPADVRVQVRAPEVTPVARDMQVLTTVDRPATFTLDGVGRPEAQLEYAVATPPEQGAVALDGPEATYTPPADFVGFDSFTYTVSDGTETSAAGTVDVFVEAQNRPPIAGDVVATVPQRDGGSFTLIGSDPDDDPIDFRVVQPPEHGTVVIIGDEATYLPHGDFFGEDVFTYEAFDGLLVSEPALAVVTVAYVNRPPVSEDGAAEVDEGGTVAIPLVASDPDGDPLIYSVRRAPEQGQATIDGAVALYAPTPGTFGEDTFTWVAGDGDLESDEATVTITVRPRPPIAHDDAYTMPQADLVLAVSAAEGVLANDDPGSAAAADLVAVLPDVSLPFQVTLQRDGAFQLTLPADQAHLEVLEFPYRVGSSLGLADDGRVRITRVP